MAGISYGINTLTDLGNLVLQSLGQPMISDISDNTDPIALRMENILKVVIAEVQASIIWPENSSTVEIDTTGNTDVDGYYEFLLPSDHLRTVENFTTTSWSQFGNYIYANVSDTIKIRYLKYSEDVSNYSVQQLGVIQLTAAIRVARSLHTDARIVNTLMQELALTKAEFFRQSQVSARPKSTLDYSSSIYSARTRTGYRG